MTSKTVIRSSSVTMVRFSECLINGRCHCICTECHVTFVKGDFIIFHEITISTVELPEGRFQTFPDIFLPEKLK